VASWLPWLYSVIVLEAHGLAKQYNGRLVFAGLNLTVAQGTCLVIAGPNGSGKSTLVRLLCGLTRPTAGEVTVTIGASSRPPRECRSFIGLVAPDLALYNELTALENLAFFAKVRGLHLDRSALEGLLARVGLAGRGHDLVATYSSGMKQRLKYAQALLHGPRLLFLDEPTTNLDEAGIQMVAEIVAEQKKRGLLVLATNDPAEVPYGDQVLRLGQQ